MTVPVGVPLPLAAAVTVAVNVTAWLRTDGSTDDVTTGALPSELTTCERAVEVLPLKLALPQSAVIEWLPTARDDVVNEAEPPLIASVSRAVGPS